MNTLADIQSGQRGAVLIAALVVMLVLTVLAVAGSRSALIEERMTGNVQDSAVAFQLAEASLRAGELLVQAPELPYFSGSDGLYQPAPATGPALWLTVDWSSPAAVRLYQGHAGAPAPLAAASAAYLVEELPRVLTPGESLAADNPVDEARSYRITARASGPAGNAEVTLQSTYRR